MKWHGEHNRMKFYLNDETGIHFSDWPAEGTQTDYWMEHETLHALWMWIDGLTKAAREDAIRDCIAAVKEKSGTWYDTLAEEAIEDAAAALHALGKL